MQDRFVGDIGDYFKYSLLRALSVDRKLGVVWYLTPDESGNNHGSKISYLDRPDRWKHVDNEVFDVLKGIVAGGARSVGRIERSGLLRDSVFFSDRLCYPRSMPRKRSAIERWRNAWFEDAMRRVKSCDIVFADPDNGLCESEKFYPGREKDWKRLPLIEAEALAYGRTAVLYHHNTRRRGGHREEIRFWLETLSMPAVALRWRAGGSRTFFVVNPSASIRKRAVEVYKKCESMSEIFEP